MKNNYLTCLLLVLFTLFLAGTYAQTKQASLNHIALSVTNLKESTDFYQKVIGLDTMPEPFHDGKHTWFRLGTHTQMHLIADASKRVEHAKNTHFCFSVPSVDQFVKKLEKEGIFYQDRDGKLNTITLRVDGVKQIYLLDPDNYWVEINDDKY